jgi:hypothetical protein
VPIDYFGLQSNEQPKRLRITFKAATLHRPLSQCLLAVMTKRWVTEIMRQTRCFDNVRVDTQPIREFSTNLRYLQ